MTLREVSYKQWRATPVNLAKFTFSRLQRFAATLNVFSEASENPTAWVFLNYKMEKDILFYDGNCGLCNRVVQWVIRFEKSPKLYFSPIESDFATRFFEEKGCAKPDLSTFYLYTSYQLYSQSTGFFKVLPFLKWYFSFLNIFKLIPICQRDQLYRFVAKNRKRFQPKNCKLNNSIKYRILID